MVVLLGAYTRLTHAGLGCPDWPGCYGFISVPKTEAQLAHAELHYPESPVEEHKGRNEMVHRYFAGGLALMLTLTLINYRVRPVYAPSRRHAPSFWQHAHVLLHLGPHR